LRGRAKARAVLDTGVIIEYVDESGEYHEQAEAVFNAVLRGRVEAVIPHPILAETYYVAARVYRALGLSEPGVRACRLVEWLYRLSSPTIRGEDLETALEAGRAKMRYGLALTDCYVLATAKVHRCRAVFRKREREMLKVVAELEREYPVIFLEDYR